MSDERLDNHSSQPATVDLFGGEGGLSYGMQQAGMTIAGGIDTASPACQHPFLQKPLAMTSELHGVQSAPYCILDIETAGPITQPPDTYELLLVGVKHERQHAIFRCNRRELGLFATFVDGFKGTVVTFNGNRFDLPILSHALQLVTGKSLRVSKHYDILSKVEQHAGRRISLDALARENLGIGKSEWDHRRNKEIWQSSPELLIAHNQEDLNLTARLFEMVLQRQPLKVDGMTVLLPLDPVRPLVMKRGAAPR